MMYLERILLAGLNAMQPFGDGEPSATIMLPLQIISAMNAGTSTSLRHMTHELDNALRAIASFQATSERQETAIGLCKLVETIPPPHNSLLQASYLRLSMLRDMVDDVRGEMHDIMPNGRSRMSWKVVKGILNDAVDKLEGEVRVIRRAADGWVRTI